MILPTYAEMHETLIKDGYYLKDTSVSGSRYYVGLHRPYVRVSDHHPNGPTQAWINRNGVYDYRVALSRPNEVAAVEEKEVGYHQHPAISRGMIATLVIDGPRTFEAMYITRTIPPEDETREMMIGSLTHQQVLEPHLESGVVLIPDEVLSDGSRRGKAWKEFEKLHEGKACLKQSEYQEAIGAVLALRKKMSGLIEHPKAVREHEIYWTHEPTGLPLRAKLDLLVKDDVTWWLPDLKTCADLSRFGYQVEKQALWLQAAHYRAAVRAKYQREAEFWFCAVEKKSINRVRHFEFDPDAITEADLRYESELLELHRRIEANDWSEDGERGSIMLTKRQCFGWSGRE